MNGRAKRMAHGVIAGGIAGIVLLQLGRAGAAGESGQQPIPRVWDDEALAGFELPPPDADIEVHHIPSAYYYALDERVIHRTHPVYHPDFEPEGYLDSLRALGPGTQLDTDTLDTDEEWIRAGEVVFDSPQLFLPADQPGFGAAALAEEGLPVAAGGTFPFHSYVVREDGEVWLGLAACSNCHLRVMPDGSVFKAVQGNYILDRLVARNLRRAKAAGTRFRAGAAAPITAEEFLAGRTREQFGAPWVDHVSQTMIDTLSIDHAIALHESIPQGALLRQGTHFFYPAKVPDLRGVRHQRFLDASGLIQHRSIGDLMRYAAFTQSVDLLNRFGDFIPSLGDHPGPLPPADSVRSIVNGPFTRFTDAQAFALARYIYSLEPLPSPHEYDAETLALGERVFIEEG